MHLIYMLLLFAAALLFLSAAHPRIKPTWDLMAIGLLCWTVAALLVVANSF